MSVIKYNLNEIENIKKNIGDFTIDNNIKIIIDNIVKQINSPGYTKTPNFKNKNYNNKNYNNKNYNNKNNVNWVEIRNFKSTKLKKSEGDDKIIDNIRVNINKITDKTYDTLIIDILKSINQIDNKDCFDKMSTIIFKIISGNRFYSKIYAKLYNDLIKKNEYFKIILNNTVDMFIDQCKTISYCDPEENYNLFCENNKLNEQRRSLMLFYINTNFYNLFKENVIYNLILDIENYVNEIIHLDKSNIIDELFELLFISITNLKKNKNNKCYNEIINFITEKSKYKITDYTGFTNKSKFKCMDILDFIKK
jgi:hypothetical protein